MLKAMLGAVMLLGFGLWSARDLPIDAVPDITSPQVQINTEVAALAPEEAEMLVTRVLEQELAGLPGVTEMRSLTKFGLSQVTAEHGHAVQRRALHHQVIGGFGLAQAALGQGIGVHPVALAHGARGQHPQSPPAMARIAAIRHRPDTAGRLVTRIGLAGQFGRLLGGPAQVSRHRANQGNVPNNQRLIPAALQLAQALDGRVNFARQT